MGRFGQPGLRSITIALLLAGATLLPACKKKKQGPDLSNPRAAAITFTRAVESGDAETAHQASYAAGSEKDLIDAMAVAIPALKKLNAAAEAKFGAEARQLVEDPYLVNGVPALQQAELTGDDKRARLVNKDQRLLSVLTHVDGVWKVDVGASIAGRDITGEIPELNALGKICNELIKQIESDKIKTAADAKRELQMLILIEVRGQPATAPSSAPSTTQASAPAAP